MTIVRSAIGLLVLAGLIMLLAGCGENSAIPVGEVMDFDRRVKKLHSLESHTNRDFDKMAESIAEYLRNIQNQSTLSRCPQDFVDAYKRHIEAWEELERVVREHPDVELASNSRKIAKSTLMEWLFSKDKAAETADTLIAEALVVENNFKAKLRQAVERVQQADAHLGAIADKYISTR